MSSDASQTTTPTDTDGGTSTRPPEALRTDSETSTTRGIFGIIARLAGSRFRRTRSREIRRRGGDRIASHHDDPQQATREKRALQLPETRAHPTAAAARHHDAGRSMRDTP